MCLMLDACEFKVEKEIINWVNAKLESVGKESRISGFQDSKIASAKPLIDLIDAIKPGVINYELLQEGGNYEASSIFFFFLPPFGKKSNRLQYSNFPMIAYFLPNGEVVRSTTKLLLFGLYC